MEALSDSLIASKLPNVSFVKGFLFTLGDLIGFSCGNDTRKGEGQIRARHWGGRIHSGRLSPSSQRLPNVTLRKGAGGETCFPRIVGRGNLFPPHQFVQPRLTKDTSSRKIDS